MRFYDWGVVIPLALIIALILYAHCDEKRLAAEPFTVVDKCNIQNVSFCIYGKTREHYVQAFNNNNFDVVITAEGTMGKYSIPKQNIVVPKNSSKKVTLGRRSSYFVYKERVSESTLLGSCNKVDRKFTNIYCQN